MKIKEIKYGIKANYNDNNNNAEKLVKTQFKKTQLYLQQLYSS